MTIIIKRMLHELSEPYVTDTELSALLDGTADSRYGKVKRLIASNKLLHVRRGLYCLTENIGYKEKIHPFALAQYIYGPSYISLESALNFHQLIPEAVYTTTCVSSKRSKEFTTPIGLFSFQHLPIINFYTGVERIIENGHTFMIASPWKAICDYVYCYKKNWRSIEPLIESLRIEPESLPNLRNEERQLLEEYYHHQRITRFLKGIINER